MTQRIWLVTLLLVVGIPLVYPIWLGVASAFVADDGAFTLFHVANVFSDPVLRDGLMNAFLIATCTTTVAVCIALPLAMLSARTTFAGKGILSTLILAPLVLPPENAATKTSIAMGCDVWADTGRVEVWSRCDNDEDKGDDGAATTTRTAVHLQARAERAWAQEEEEEAIILEYIKITIARLSRAVATREIISELITSCRCV